ncbi:MAG: toxic anion resistance protein [Clostridia bacterium]|nr:toxic anion resistance protein [Clostridia bacterium]
MAELEMQNVPTLTLDPMAVETKEDTLAGPEFPADAPAVPSFEESSLSEAELKIVNDFAQKIELNNSNVILQYGAAAQKKVADFSEQTLNSVRTKDLGEVGDMLTNVVVELKDFDQEEERKGIFAWFKRASNRITTLRAKYDKAEANIDKIVTALEGHQITLLKDIALLDQMYELNLTYFKELSMYILAGKKKLAEVRSGELVRLTEKAKASGLQEDAQAANDLAGLCNRFEKKLHDLELTRMISIQMGPQIRLVQGNDTLMTEKIQSTLVNTIPLWKSQMVLALGVAHSQQAAEAQRDVTDLTNSLLRKNAETLKMATVATAKESERGIVDMDTLRHTNEQLISTLDEVLRIQEEGRQNRRAAEQELRKIEDELKTKLLDIRG